MGFLSFSYSYKDLLDIATKIAVQAKMDGLSKHQIENVIESLYMVDDPRDALLIAQLYAQRQAMRLTKEKEGKEKGYKERGPLKSMSMMSEVFNDIYNKGKDRTFASQFLHLVKWIYESIGEEDKEKSRLPENVNAETITFDELMKILRGKS